MSKNIGFTLAEVLITLGLIGVVAAITIPAFIQNYKKQIVGKKLAKFYSVMNQALITSKAEKGELSFDQVYLTDSEYLSKWYRENIIKYINTIKDEKAGNTYYMADFIDGSGFNSYFSGTQQDGTEGLNNLYVFYCINFKKCNLGRFDGKNSFLFIINVEKAKMNTYGTTNSHASLVRDCANPARNWGCATLIMQNNWEVPDDYPLKF